MKKRNLLILGFLVVGVLFVLELNSPILSNIEINPKIGVNLSPESLNQLDNFEGKLLSIFIGRPNFLFNFMIFFNNYSNLLLLILIGSLLILLSIRSRMKFFFAFISSLLSASMVVFLLKLLFQRIRPLESLVNYSSFSFPSGHAAVIFSILPVFVKKYPKFKYLFYAISLLVLYNRVYLGLHYFTDLIVGAIIGYVIGLFFVKYSKL
jgi:undecaprenyl-diphosphatase